MKKYFLILIGIIIFQNIIAQDIDTTVIKIKNRRIVVLNEKIEKFDTSVNEDGFFNIDNDYNPHWAGFGIGLNSYVNSDFKMDVGNKKYLEIIPEKSFNIMLNFAEKSFPIVKDNFMLTTGLGFDFNNYRFLNNYRLISDSSVITARFDSTNTFIKSKLSVTNFSIPLMLEFQLPSSKISDDRIFFSVGAVAQLRIGSHTKYVYKSDGNVVKNKDKDRFHLSPFSINYIAMIGYNDFSFYAKYSYSSLFYKNQGPELYPISFGIILHI